MRSDFAVAVVVILLLTGGCALVKQPVPHVPVISEQERSFAGALGYLKSGKEQQARELLERVVALPTVYGVTDEALFRLALLCIRDDAGRVAIRARSLLTRLENDFPASLWTRQAAPLMEYLDGVRSLRESQKQLKTLRDHNLSLSRDNRDLRQTIERLKSLDLELDKKIKR